MSIMDGVKRRARSDEAVRRKKRAWIQKAALLLAALVLAAVPGAAPAESDGAQNGQADSQQAAETRAADPVHIGSAEELRLLAEQPEGSFVLDGDLDLSGVSWHPIRFAGTLDGGGHVIRGLTVTEFAPETGTTMDGNGKKYPTQLAGFFSVLDHAVLRNIRFEDARVNVRSDEHAFAAVVAAISSHAVLENVSLQGSACLYCGGKMGGVGGLLGFGTGTLRDCTAEVTLIYADTNKTKKCEQFMGGAIANGFVDCYNVSVEIDGYASVYGYAHCGGVIGMFRQNEKRTKENSVTHIFDCRAGGQITFFEKNSDRRAYCKGIIGERLNKYVKMENNDESAFVRNEIRKYDEILLPEGWED